MSAHEEQVEGSRDGWFVAAAAAVGDLGHPFYREERQRDVWNEASAVGLQLVLWLGLAVAAGMVWLGGAEGLPYAWAVMAVVGTAGWVTLLYAARLGVRGDESVRLLRWRMVPYLVLAAVFAVGALRASAPAGVDAGTAWGMVVGGSAALVALELSLRRARRRAGRGEV